MTYRSGWIKFFRACIHAIHNLMAAIEPECIFQLIQSISGRFITRINNPAIGLQQSCRTKKAITIPPPGWAGGCTAGTQNTLVRAIQTLTVFR